MKRLIAFTTLLLAALSSCAQEIPQSLVPSVVVNTFQQKFPKAYDLEWEKKGEWYEAEFDLAFKDHKVLMNGTGKIVKHKEEISTSDLPVAVREILKDEFSSFKIDEAYRIETEGTVIYKVELENATGERKIYFDEDGKVIEAKTFYE